MTISNLTFTSVITLKIRRKTLLHSLVDNHWKSHVLCEHKTFLAWAAVVTTAYSDLRTTLLLTGRLDKMSTCWLSRVLRMRPALCPGQAVACKIPYCRNVRLQLSGRGVTHPTAGTPYAETVFAREKHAKLMAETNKILYLHTYFFSYNLLSKRRLPSIPWMHATALQ